MIKVFSTRDHEVRVHNGSPKIEEHPTLDTRVVLLIIPGDFEWANRDSTEVFRCEKCNSFVLPGEQHIPCKKEEKEHEDAMGKD